MIEMDDYRSWEHEIRRIQALWRGGYVRQQMKKVQDEYVMLFKELENSTALEVQWKSVLSKPKFLSVRNKLKLCKTTEQTTIQSDQSAPGASGARLTDEIPERERPTHDEDVIQFSTKLTGDAVTQTSEVADSQEHHGDLVDTHSTPSVLINPSVSHHQPEDKRQDCAETLHLDEERRNLALELLWLQQAIFSRKQYLYHKAKIVQLGST